jgi:uncharacterized coiled-coil protein SlyX
LTVKPMIYMRGEKIVIKKLFLYVIWVAAFFIAYIIVTSGWDYFFNAKPTNGETDVTIEELEDRIIELEVELADQQSTNDYLQSQNDELESALEGLVEDIDSRLFDIEWKLGIN